MKNLKKCILLPFSLFSVAFLSLGTIQPSYATKPSCQEKLNSVLEDIRGKGTGVEYRIHDDYESLNSTFGNTKRISRIHVVLNANRSSGRADSVAANILSSPVLMKSYANQIFSHCGGTGNVDFNMDQTDWLASFVMKDNGVLGFEECSEYPYDLTQQRISQIYGPGLGGYCAYVVPDF
ncbi:MAG: hypothetical protein HC796_01480 [Synechococcaceae cyanobacterium RL_1_2]|nr:hypothetical protein [Synechococcaceae cyanobacterium RL_1_2]